MIDISTAAIGPGAASAPSAGTADVQAGYGVSLSDISGFEHSMSAAGQRLEAAQVAGPQDKLATQVLQPFERINTEVKELEQIARTAQTEGRELKPSEIVTLTARCQEFSFHCTLMSSLAGKTSEGLSQLFRQQS